MKAKILKVLKENQGKFVSGEMLSSIFGVSRTAIWKHIRELRKDGFVIESSSKKGYVLQTSPDILDPFEIVQNLSTEVIGKRILRLDSIDSTNNYAKKKASEGCEDGTAVIAETQTSGRGRLGREWNSSDKKGIWMSVILKPDIAPEEAQIITLAASVAVVKAVKSVTGIDTAIKWPNDVILDGKKVCGILTEMNTEIDRINYIVVGIGVNVNHEKADFPEELRDKAVSLKMFSKDDMDSKKVLCENYERNMIITSILFELEQKYSKIKKGFFRDIVEEWKLYSATIGKEVRVISRNSEYIGVAIDVAPDGKLIVRCSDGETREVASGEISVRGIMGYSPN
ncbi:MAG TPA: biotin--[acetyl-CoA-carboxylase] ligase [Clostridia bacterium]|nr:biotin--[acetyl-CoA-carboxylase] ligase [Clostridia bacterium]